MDRSDLERLSREQLINLVLRLQRPDKTSRTSSRPPSLDRKEKRENARPGGAQVGHEPHNRLLASDPDAFENHAPSVCERCGASFSTPAALRLVREYDEIDLPAVHPHVIRHRRFSCRCTRCGFETKAKAPAVASTTPFGPRIQAVAHYLKGFQAVSYERLRHLFRDVFGLRISEGALGNMFARRRGAFAHEAEKAQELLRQSCVIASDETGVRIEGANAYHWVFHCPQAVVHHPDAARGAQVVRDMMDGHTPEVWISDRYSAQQKHGRRHQTCLAYLARDVAFALEHGADLLPLRFSFWFKNVFALARSLPHSARQTVAARKTTLEKQLIALTIAPSGCELARKLQAKIARARDQLLTFCDYANEVEAANNGSERLLRPCVIQRKVTNGYRSMWAAQAEANMRTAVDTARLKGKNPFQTISAILT